MRLVLALRFGKVDGGLGMSVRWDLEYELFVGIIGNLNNYYL